MAARDRQPAGTVRPTSWRAVAIAILLGAGVGWFGFAIPERFGLPLAQLPLPIGVAIAGLAVLVGVQAWFIHRRIHVRSESIDPSRGITLLALGKTCLLAGAGLAAGYLAVAVYFAGRLDAELPRERVISAVVGALASLGLAVAGTFLERACRIPDPPGSDGAPQSRPGSPASPD